jgi:hypothetical protein
MKCDLCKHQNIDGNILCNDCSVMIRRLMTIEQRMAASAASSVGNTEGAANASNAASGQ